MEGREGGGVGGGGERLGVWLGGERRVRRGEGGRKGRRGRKGGGKGGEGGREIETNLLVRGLWSKNSTAMPGMEEEGEEEEEEEEGEEGEGEGEGSTISGIGVPFPLPLFLFRFNEEDPPIEGEEGPPRGGEEGQKDPFREEVYPGGALSSPSSSKRVLCPLPRVDRVTGGGGEEGEEGEEIGEGE